MAKLRTYRIEYRDLDPACPVFATRVKAYDRDHAIERFWEADPDDDGWRILSVREVR